MNIHTILFDVLSPGLKFLELGQGRESKNILRFLKANLSNFLSDLFLQQAVVKNIFLAPYPQEKNENA